MANFAFVTPTGQLYQSSYPININDSELQNASSAFIASLSTSYPVSGSTASNTYNGQFVSGCNLPNQVNLARYWQNGYSN